MSKSLYYNYIRNYNSSVYFIFCAQGRYDQVLLSFFFLLSKEFINEILLRVKRSKGTEDVPAERTRSSFSQPRIKSLRMVVETSDKTQFSYIYPFLKLTRPDLIMSFFNGLYLLGQYYRYGREILTHPIFKS